MSMYSRVLCTALCLVAFLAYGEPALAQRVTTNATFTTPVQLPDVLLPAGDYHFSIARDRRSVVVSQAGGRVITTLQVVPVTREKRGTTITMSAPVEGAVPEVLALFSGGGTEGIQFKQRQK
jgi:hypothetical protein